MHINWDKLSEFRPRGWSVHKLPDSLYMAPPRFVTDQIAQGDVGSYIGTDDVAFILCVCIKSISRVTTQQGMPLTPNMLRFIRHALHVHFGSTMNNLKDGTIQAVAMDLNTFVNRFGNLRANPR